MKCCLSHSFSTKACAVRYSLMTSNFCMQIECTMTYIKASHLQLVNHACSTDSQVLACHHSLASMSLPLTKPALITPKGTRPTMHDEGGRAYLQEGCSAQQDELQERNSRWTQSETAVETAKQTWPLAQVHHRHHPLMALLLLPSLLLISCCLKQ